MHDSEPVEMAWMAGFFEGEGTVSIVGGGKRPYTRLRVAVTNTDRETLHLFQKRWPAKQLRCFQPKSKNAKMAYIWTLSCKKAEKFFKDIQPYIRTKRVSQKIALALQCQSERVMGSRRNCKAYRAKFEAYKQMMHQLNHRGVGVYVDKKSIGEEVPPVPWN